MTAQGNVTGLSQGAREEFSKRLELMRMLVPRMRELVVFLHPVVVSALSGLYEGVAREVGTSVRIVVASQWLEAMPRGSAQAGFVVDRLESPGSPSSCPIRSCWRSTAPRLEPLA